METERWIVTYSESQKCYHREELSDYLAAPENGYRVVAVFNSAEDCYKYISEQIEAERNEKKPLIELETRSRQARELARHGQRTGK